MENKIKYLIFGFAVLIIIGLAYIVIVPDDKPGDSKETAGKNNSTESKNSSSGIFSLLSSDTGDDSGDNKGRQKSLTEDDIEQLRSKFPDSIVVPPINEIQAMERKKEKEERNRIFGQIQANRTTEKVVHEFYKEQQDLTKETLEVIEYAMQEFGPKLSEKSNKILQFSKDIALKKLDMLPKKEQAAIDRLKEKQKRKNNP